MAMVTHLNFQKDQLKLCTLYKTINISNLCKSKQVLKLGTRLVEYFIQTKLVRFINDSNKNHLSIINEIKQNF